MFKLPTCNITLNEYSGRHRHKLKGKNDTSNRYPTFFNGDSISGTIELKLNSSNLKHKGIKVELHGIIEKYGKLTSRTPFLYLKQDLAPAGEIVQEKTIFEFNFRNPYLKYESYKGNYASVIYFVKLIID